MQALTNNVFNARVIKGKRVKRKSVNGYNSETMKIQK